MVLVVRNPPASAGDVRDMGSIPGSGRFPGIGNGNPLQYSCLENPRVGGARWAAVYGVAQGQTRLKQLSRDVFKKIRDTKVTFHMPSLFRTKEDLMQYKLPPNCTLSVSSFFFFLFSLTE